MRVAATATILLNVTLMAAVGTLIVTPDAPLLVAASFVLFFLAKVLETGRGAWWLAVGAAVGAALLSKYTALFFGPAILIWLVGVPKLRRWLRLAVALSRRARCAGAVLRRSSSGMPITTGCPSSSRCGRAQDRGFQPGFIAELIPTQIAFATPLVFILGAMGLYALARAQGRRARRARADQCDVLDHRGLFRLALAACPRRGQLVRAGVSGFRDCRRGRRASARHGRRARSASPIFACAGPRPVGIVMFALLIVQADTGWLSGYRRDATVRSVGVGWRELAAGIEAVRVRTGAACVLAPDYGTTGWLAFYLPKGIASCSRRSASAGSTCRNLIPSCSPASCSMSTRCGPAVTAVTGGRVQAGRTGRANCRRMRGPLVIETYGLDLLEGAKGEVLDRSPPPELE